MEWRCVDQEHDKCATCKDPEKVVLIANNGFPEWQVESRLDRKNLNEAGLIDVKE
jgi:hypothetical protein